MIRKFSIRNFKGMSEFVLELDKINILAGGNNSGKTTIFHALQLFFWCLEKIAQEDGGQVILKKTQIPEIGAIPYFVTKDIFYRQKMRDGKRPTRINFEVEADKLPKISIDIYPAFSRNVMIDGKDKSIKKAQYLAFMKLRPVFIPSSIGIMPHEELYREVAQDRLIAEGRHNQVLRNMVFRLSKNRRLWNQYKELIQPLFQISNVEMPFNEDEDEWLSALYDENGCRFDFISAGSGFLQVSNILSFLLLNKSSVALLDEPDAHMHDDLQDIVYEILYRVAKKKNLQLLISTHSPTLIEAAGPENVLVIDRNKHEPLKAIQLHELKATLAQYGITLNARSVYDALIDSRILFVEGVKSDYELFLKKFGNLYNAEFSNSLRKVVVLGTNGITNKWPVEAIGAFKELVKGDIKSLLVSDRDFNTDQEVADRMTKMSEQGLAMVALGRRHREAYLLDPKVLSRLLKRKFIKKNKNSVSPKELSKKAIHEFILKQAIDLEAGTRAKFTAEKPVQGSREEKEKILKSLGDFFDKNYRDVLQKQQIPFVLLDSKAVLASFRGMVNSNYKLSFSDDEILSTFKKTDLHDDIKLVLDKIIEVLGG